jgi:hypothetical protein
MREIISPEVAAVYYRLNMPQKIRPKKQVVVPPAEQRVLKGTFAGLDLLRDIEEENRIDCGRDIR